MVEPGGEAGAAEVGETAREHGLALHRLVEAYLALGINDEAQAAGAVLGYNYPGSEWYADSYALVGTGELPRDERPGRPRVPRRDGGGPR